MCVLTGAFSFNNIKITVHGHEYVLHSVANAEEIVDNINKIITDLKNQVWNE